MPVRPLFLCAWVWWLQLTALQSERVPLLGVRQYSKPPASGLEWIVLSVALFCKRVQQLLTTRHELPVGPAKRKSRRHVEDGSTTKAKGWNSFRGRSQSEQHSVFRLFIGCPGTPQSPIGWKAAFGFCSRAKGFAWLTLFGWLQWQHWKKSLIRTLSYPHTVELSKSQLFIFISEKSMNAVDWNWSWKCLSSNRKQPSACLLTPTRTPEDCPDILHDFQTLTRCNLRVTQLLLPAHALVNRKGLSDCYLWCLFWLILVIGQSLDVKGHCPFFATHHFSVFWCLSSFELTSCFFFCFFFKELERQKYIYTKGCVGQFEKWLQDNLIIVAGIFVGIALLQVGACLWTTF